MTSQTAIASSARPKSGRRIACLAAAAGAMAGAVGGLTCSKAGDKLLDFATKLG